MSGTTSAPGTAWSRGRLDRRSGPGQVLFGRMYEDASVELEAFRGRSRIFCIASAGCTAMKLAPLHAVTAVDVNPAQIEYARGRFLGGRASPGVAERFMAFARALAPFAGWRRSRVRAFLELDDPAEQVRVWREQLDTRRFRASFDGLFSPAVLRRIYAPSFLEFLPRGFGAVLRARMERCFARHGNRSNPYARLLLAGEGAGEPAPEEAKTIRLVCADAAEFLEQAPAASFDGFTLSNILDGCDPGYGARLSAAVERAAAPGAVLVQRSFREPPPDLSTNRAAEDRSMLWGIVAVRSA